MTDQTAARTYDRHEPVAIVGIGCRLPTSIEDPTALWQALLKGVDVVRQVSANRWNATAWAAAEASGQAANRRGGFLDDVTGFDAEYFGIPPAEARQMDPQQRIALEVACAAVEDARRSTASLAGTRTGVFMGAMWQEYPLFTQGAAEAIHAHSAIGWDNSVIPSRIAYALGLRGPALGVATASSSSLVAVHLAVQSLRSGESDFALAGGVNLMLHPNTSVALTKLGAQSPAGLSRAFDGEGDGYARGEGCAVVVLRRLSDALADGDRVYALVHGSAVNNDGATDGLTAPSHEAQTEVLRSAWENAGVAPCAVSYVEAHGTGTPLGDVTEAGALGAVFGPGRAAPLRIGSAKTNFGHLEPAAGVLGLVKAALAVHHGVIPPSLHFRTPNPRIDFSAERLDVVTEAAAWPAGPRFAGVSSFGYGGTNAHVALGEAPETPRVRAAADAGGPVCLAVSGTNPHSLARNAARLASHLGQSPGTRLSDVAYSLATTRTHHPARGVVIAATTDEAVAGLRALAADESHDAVVTGAAAGRGRVAFVFPGQGAQWWGMGRSLWEQNDAFREAVTACDEALAPHTGFSVAAVVRGQDGLAPPFTRTDVVQPALFATYVGLAAMWRAWGVEPAAVVGHSQGEVAAAVVGGALSLADGARIVALRARAVHDHAPDGAMGLVERPVDDVVEELAAYGEALSVAVVNTARSTVVAGDAEAVDRFLARMEATGAYCQRVDVDYASHSPHMDALLPALREQLTGLSAADAGIAFYSSVTGERAAGPELDADYWCRNLREPVRFDRALERLRADGFGVFVEVSPHPVLQIALAQGTEADGAAVVVGSLRRDRGGIEQALRALAELHAQGVPVPWKRVYAASDTRRADLPTYAFEHRSYWLDEHDDAIPAVDGASWRADVRALPEAERPGSVVALVTEEAAALLGRPAEGVRPDTTLREQGFDSLMVVELRNRLSARTRVSLPTVLAFDYPTPQAIATLLLTHAGAQDEAPEVSPAVAAGPVRPDDDDPVVIVSMACRLPDGIDTPEAFWDLLVDGREASSAFPQRWDGWDLSMLEEAERAATGRRFERKGGFVRDVEDFDAAFFGLSPREALSLDPQQRLVLEVVWEAFERANLRTASLEGSNTGVYLGAMSSDYDVARRWDVGSSDGYKITGNGSSLISGRVAYTLGLSGPALTIDTACSSSLVAVRLACEALRSGECDLALAGGVTVMSTPQIFVEFSRLNGLAADGRCKSFADDADGTSWAEGCGVLVLKRLSDARRDGDRVLAVVRGTAMNQDGRSQGLTAPNGLAQQRVLRGALADGGLAPADIDAVEAHATGTVLGDPIEVGALAAVFSGRVRPLHLGSAKSNIGHAQAASGVIGVIKMVMALQHEWLPRTLHAERPNTRIDWSGGELELLRQPRRWPRTRRVRRAGISSFGISGTNTHVIIEEAPQTAVADRPGDDLVHPLVISGTDAAALRAQARHWAEWLDARPAASMRDIAYTSAVGRTHFEARAVVFAGNAMDAAEALRAVEPGCGTALGEIAFVFGSQDAQPQGMNGQLLEQSAVFRDTVTRCDAVLTPLTGWSVLKVLRGEEDVNSPDVLPCTLFATYLGRAALWRSWGVEPVAVVGDAHGEVAAAVVCGALSLEDGARVIALQARARSGDAVGGAMSGIVPARASIPFYSCRTGEVVPGTELGGDYWFRDLAEPEPMGLDRALERLRGDGFGAFVEVGPPSEDASGGVDQLWRAAATLFARGFPLDWERVLGSRGAGKVDVPTYAFQRQRFWLGELPAGPAAVTARQPAHGHPWFDAITTLAGSGGYLFTGRLTLDDCPWLADHVVSGHVYVPGAGLTDAALFAARTAGADAVADLTLLEPVVLLPGRALRIQATVGEPDAHGRRPFAFYSQPEDTDEPLIWQQHVSGECATRACDGATMPPDIDDWPVPDARALDIEAFYGRALANGLDYGPAFRGLRELACRDGVYYARVSLPGALDPADHGLHPSLFDAALQVVVAGLMKAGAPPGPLVPFIWSDVELCRAAGRELTVRVSFESGGDEDLAPATVWLADPAGHLVARIGRLKFQRGRRRGHPFAEHLYRVAFARLHPVAETSDPAGTLVVGDAELGAGLGADVVPDLDALLKRLDVEADTPRRLLFALPDRASAQEHAAQRSAAEALRTLQACFGDARLQGTELVWITRDAVSSSPDDQVGNWAHAAVWGMVRTARTEQPERVLRLIDLDPGTPDLPLLARVIETKDEPECVLRGETAHVPRARPTVEEVDALVLPDEAGWHLRQREDDQLDIIAAPHDEGVPEPVAPWEVRVEVRAARMSPQHTQVLEFAGIVTEVGSGVTSVHAGDRVSGGAAGALGHQIRVSGATLRPMPANLTFVQAAADSSAPDPRQDKGSFTAYDVRDAPYALRHAQQTAAHKSVLTLPRALDPDGTVLITGGLGELGRALAAHLVRAHGARRLVLLSRRGGSTPEASSFVRELRAAGAERVDLIAGDAADRTALAGVLAGIHPSHPLTAVFHLAGVLDDGLVEGFTAERLHRVMAPKVQGARWLDELTERLDLAAFVLFSSAAGTLGTAGQSGYAAANATLDALAANRRKRGLAGLSLAFGLWEQAGVGMTAHLGKADLGRLRRQGIGALTLTEGLHALDVALARPEAQLMPVHLELASLRHALGDGQTPPLLRDLLRRTTEGHRAEAPETAQSLGTRLADASEAERPALLLDLVRSEVADVLGLPGPDSVPTDRALRSLGIDSLTMVQLRKRLAKRLNTTLPATLVFDYPTAEAIAGLLLHDVTTLRGNEK
ncbi:type I polyketide synthase [Streptomyces sp. AN091965]|uniref:type I polyketide synthase n=1 Tax=Streptomyces sp. AN091965 TaxID=2927803 RepID=UPI001F625DB2|nr:type I polyketide synthase [Streptomyces sp. AN091965]MCI3928183.1 type I polyketide synthase [Streptomyces sp. AN091965]